MIDTRNSGGLISSRKLSAVAMLFGAVVVSGACTPDRVQTTTTEQTTTRQAVPAAMPSSTTTITRTQQTVP